MLLGDRQAFFLKWGTFLYADWLPSPEYANQNLSGYTYLKMNEQNKKQRNNKRLYIS